MSARNENMQPTPSAGKQAARGCQGRENKRRVPREGKQAAGAKGGKTSGGCQARENKRQVPRAGKQTTGTKGGKTSNGCQELENRKPMSSMRNALCRKLPLVYNILLLICCSCKRGVFCNRLPLNLSCEKPRSFTELDKTQ